jgi:hypothetical protein
MTKYQKLLCLKLFRGWYLVKSVNTKGKPVYRMYDEKRCVQKVISEKDIKAISRRTYTKIWKKDAWGRITISPVLK